MLRKLILLLLLLAPALSAQTWASEATLHWDAPSALHWDSPAVCTWLSQALLAWNLSGHTVALSWQPSTTSGVTYAVYRAASSAGPWLRIGTSGVTHYTDADPPAGTWWYAVTAVAPGGDESAQSNTISVTVP